MKMDPIIIDDNDEDVQVVCEMGQQPSRTMNLDQPVMVLTATYDSERLTPAQYRQIRACEKLLKPHFSGVTTYSTYIRGTSANVGQITLWESPPIIDLTKDLEENIVPSISQGNVDPSTSRGDVEASSAMDNLPGPVAPIDLTLTHGTTSDNNGVQQTSERNNKE